MPPLGYIFKTCGSVLRVQRPITGQIEELGKIVELLSDPPFPLPKYEIYAYWPPEI